jgi:hypothetical protein
MHATFELLKTFGIAVDPLNVYFVGQSLGAISGVPDVAVNPRVSKAVFSPGGGTLIDTFLTSPKYSPRLIALVQSIGIQPGTAAFLQFINVAKWIIDPADPLNFAGYLRQPGQQLPSFLASFAAPMAAKKVLGQYAHCDQSVPNFVNLELYTNIGLGPLSQTQSTTTLFTTDVTKTSPLDCLTTSAGSVAHGFLTDWGTDAGTPAGITVKAQGDVANFLSADTLPAPVETFP